MESPHKDVCVINITHFLRISFRENALQQYLPIGTMLICFLFPFIRYLNWNNYSVQVMDTKGPP